MRVSRFFLSDLLDSFSFSCSFCIDRILLGFSDWLSAVVFMVLSTGLAEAEALKREAQEEEDGAALSIIHI